MECGYVDGGFAARNTWQRKGVEGVHCKQGKGEGGGGFP